jgi:uridine kinase
LRLKNKTCKSRLQKDRVRKMITVKINGEERQYPQGATYEDVANDYQQEYENLIALAARDGKIRELFKKLTRDCEVTFFTLKDDVGNKTYVRSATMLFLKAVFDVYGREAAQSCRVEFAIGNGSYISPKGKINATEENAAKIRNRMRELVEAKTPFLKRSYSLDNAMELFRKEGMKDKEKLFRYRRGSFVNIYEMDGYYDYYYGYMLPNAGYVKWFDVIAYEDGFMLLLPDKKDPTHVKPFQERKLLFRTLKESEEWGKEIGIETVGDLNDQICRGSLSELILVQEAQQERKIGEIAKSIVDRGGVKFVMIAGPSSSGKTSFSHRLSIQLKTLGKTPHPIALDDYFVNREFTPRDENGDYNFECLEAIDVKQFNDDMCRLLAGERVELPSFNFKTGKREYKGNFKQLGPDDILVIEGIHGLNEKTSYALPEESKYKIYISALTNINIDEHNRIPTTDGRLLRRMVRDARTRGADARRTIDMWASVRRGEEQNIFPFQEDADAMFNSVLIYELAVLKQFAEPLLFQIDKGEPEYYEAKRLLKFLEYFLGVTSESLPNNSLCREFVGGSCFNV